MRAPDCQQAITVREVRRQNKSSKKRLGYLLAAVLGYGLIRSAVFWNAALAGIILYLVALLA